MKRKSGLFASVCAVVLVLTAALAHAGYDKNILVRGTQLGGINGMSFDPQGENLWIARSFDNEIAKINPYSGDVLLRIGKDQGVDNPPAVVVGADGSVYWVEFFTGSIKKRTPSGTIQVLGNVGSGADGIALSSDGRLYVSNFSPTADQLWEIDPNGVVSARLITQNTMGGLNAFAVGPDQMIYGPSSFGSVVLRIDPQTGAVAPVSGGYVSLYAVQFDRNGEMYVLDEGVGKVYKVDRTTGAKTEFAAVPRGSDALTFNKHNFMYYGSAYNGKMAFVLPFGGQVSIARAGMIFPSGVAVIPSTTGGADRVFVADEWSLLEFNGNTGALVNSDYFQGLPHLTESGIDVPMAVSRMGDKLILTSFLLNSVRVWDPNTHLTVAVYPGLAAPLNAVQYSDSIAIAQLGTGSVTKASDGSVIASGLAVASGLASDGGDLWVAENLSGRILKIAQGGVPLNPPVVTTTGLSFPEGLAIGSDGHLLVVEAGTKKLLRVDKNTGVKTVLARRLAVGAASTVVLPPVGLALSSVALGSSGQLYVTGDEGNVLYRLDQDLTK